MSESNLREIMYIGRKPTKTDNVNEGSGIEWYGMGDVQRCTSLQTVNLLRHPKIWMDVTGWDDARRTELVATLQEEFRAEQRRLAQAPTLATASLDELQAELERRKGLAPIERGVKTGDVKTQRAREVTDDLTGEPASRPDRQEDLLNAIVATVMDMDTENTVLFDDNGDPTLEAVTQALGYSITASELNAALERL